jgi:hypothetical protein
MQLPAHLPTLPDLSFPSSLFLLSRPTTVEQRGRDPAKSRCGLLKRFRLEAPGVDDNRTGMTGSGDHPSFSPPMLIYPK